MGQKHGKISDNSFVVFRHYEAISAHGSRILNSKSKFVNLIRHSFKLHTSFFFADAVHPRADDKSRTNFNYFFIVFCCKTHLFRIKLCFARNTRLFLYPICVPGLIEKIFLLHLYFFLQ